MQEVPQDVTDDTVDSLTDTYEYELSEVSEGMRLDKYSFGLTGECSSNTSWRNISVHPKIIATWHVEPILDEDRTEEKGWVVEEDLKNEVNKDESSEKEVGEEDVLDKDDANEDI